MIKIYSLDLVKVDDIARGTLVNFIRTNPRFPKEELDAAVSEWWAAVLADRDARLEELSAQKDEDKAAALAARNVEKESALTALAAEKDAVIASKDSQLESLATEKDAVIASLAEKRESDLTALAAEKDSIIASHQSTIDTLTATISERDSEIETLKARIELLENPPAPVIPTLTQRQFRLALLSLGIRSVMIEEMLNNIEDPIQKEAAFIEWEYASVIQRDNPLIANVAAMLGKTDSDIDALFESAKAL